MIHARDIEYRRAAYLIDCDYWAIPVDADTVQGAPVIPSAGGLPDTWVNLGFDADDAWRILALRHHLDEWHKPVLNKQLYLGRLFIDGKHWWVLDSAGLVDALRESIEEQEHRIKVPDEIADFVDWPAWRARQAEVPVGERLARFDNLHHQQTIETDIGPMVFHIFRIK